MNTVCIYCFQELSHKQDFFTWIKRDTCLCGECQMKLKCIQRNVVFSSMPMYILYEYNDFLESMIYQYKEGRDIAMKTVFFKPFIQRIEKRYKGYTMVLMPSSKEKTQERGFHALRSMLEEINLPKIEPFYKSENRKQSLQSVEQRAHIDEILHLDSTMILPKDKLLLVDDVCTTGSTIKCAYKLLQPHTLSIEALVLCANPLFMKAQDNKNIKRWPQLRKRKGVEDVR